MCILKIDNFYGRSGNNILQVINNIYKYLGNIKKLDIKNHKLFITNKKNDLISKCNCDNIINCNTEFLLKSHPLKISKIKNIFNEHCEFTIPIQNSCIYDVGIHIRSGDIFNVIGRSHRLYLQPPFYYYKKIIDKNINKKVVIVFENKKNPVINKLIESYKNNKNIIFQSSAIENDIISLSNCKTLVFSNGTFCLLPYVFSNTITNIVIPDFLENNLWYSFDKNETEVIELPNYIPYNKWNNTLSQQKLMIEYAF